MKHKSRLEKEKEAALELAASETQGGKPRKDIPSASSEGRVRALHPTAVDVQSTVTLYSSQLWRLSSTCCNAP